MAYIGRPGATAPLTSADIPDNTITASKIVDGAVDFQNELGFLENASGTQNLTGTYSTERMYLNDSYTLTGNVTVTGHLSLGTIADSDVVITQDSTERTITGSGTLEAGRLMNDQPSLTGMTGELGSTVTGSPNLNLTTGLANASTTFPVGHILQVVSDSNETEWSHNTTTATATPYSQAITPSSDSNKILITFASPIRINDVGQTDGFARLRLYKNGSAHKLLSNAYGLNVHGGNLHYSITFLDSPATDSAVTYAIYVECQNAASIIFNDSGSIGSLTLMEIVS